MKVVISPRAEKQLRKLPKIDQIAVGRKIRKIAEDKPVQVEKIQNHNDIFRVRIGNYRIVYRQFRNKLYVILIGHRKDIYNLLRQLLGH